jgi:hypothetical protein
MARLNHLGGSGANNTSVSVFAIDRFALNLYTVQGISEFACMQSSSLSPSSALAPRRIIRRRIIVELDQRLDPVTISTSRTHLRIVHSLARRCAPASPLFER